MTELAKCPNVVVKLGGMMMRLAAYDYGALALPPTSAELAAHLGALHRRPASSCSAPTAACSRATSRWRRWASATATLWNAFKRIAAGASADEKTALFSGTAQRAYRLDLA